MRRAVVLSFVLFLAGWVSLVHDSRAQFCPQAGFCSLKKASVSSPIAFVAGTNAASTDGNNVTSSAINTTGANFLILVVSSLSGTAQGTVSDSKSNTWTPLTLSDEGTFVRARFYYSPSATVGSGHTFTLTSTAGLPSISVASFSNVNASPFDVQNTANDNATTHPTGSITPSQNNELAVTGISNNNGTMSSIDSSFNIVGTPAPSGGFNLGCGMAYLIQTTAGAVSPTWTGDTFSRSASVIASFKN